MLASITKPLVPTKSFPALPCLYLTPTGVEPKLTFSALPKPFRISTWNAKVSSLDKELVILQDSYHMVLYDNEKEFVFAKCLEFMNQHQKAVNLVSESEAVCC